jgi:phosphohistidine phosphatase SixA
MIVFLTRHAWAGDSAKWAGDDRLRPLDERGRRQAEALVSQLEGRKLARIVSSPYMRCVETVVPLAAARSLEVEPDEALAEGAGPGPALELFRNATGPLLVSVHGDLCEALLGKSIKKGATTVLDVKQDGLEVLERLKPQA